MDLAEVSRMVRVVSEAPGVVVDWGNEDGRVDPPTLADDETVA